MVSNSKRSKKRSLISVCIANYNGQDVIDACIKSVLSQDSGCEIEVIVHDDASTDESKAIVECGYPSVILIESRENVGFCVSTNRMVARARGNYLLLLNNDAELMPGAIQALMQAAEKGRGDDVLTLPQFSRETGELLDRGMYLDPFANPIPNRAEGTREVATVMGACLWIEKALWKEIGGFPEWFESIGEDMYLCQYARLLNKNVAVIDRSGYYHRVGHSFGGGKATNSKLSTSYKRRRLSERNKTYVIFLFYPAAMLLILLPVHLLLLLLEGLTLSCLKRDIKPFRDIYLYTIGQFLSNFRPLWRCRKAIWARAADPRRNFLRGFKIFPQKLRLLMTHGLPRIE